MAKKPTTATTRSQRIKEALEPEKDNGLPEKESPFMMPPPSLSTLSGMSQQVDELAAAMA